MATLSSLDPRPALERLRVHARSLRYCINLDERVRTDEEVVIKGGYAIVRKGKLGPPVNGVAVEYPEGLEIAIKTPPGGLRDDEATIKRFLKETHTWSKLKHKNILPLVGISTKFDLSVSIVSEWIGEGNARDYVQHNPNIDPRPLIQGIAHGLYYLHHHDRGPVVHGDLKGSNVLITKNGEALLTDFGFSCLTVSSFSMSTSAAKGP
ncbi:hypothetical protein ID866_8819, partial [Astraeus odoratus]